MFKYLFLGVCCLLISFSCKKSDDPKIVNSRQSLSFRLVDGNGKDMVVGPQARIAFKDISLKAGNTNLALQEYFNSDPNSNTAFIYTDIDPVITNPGGLTPLVLTVLRDGKPQIYNLSVKTSYTDCCGYQAVGWYVNNISTFIPPSWNNVIFLTVMTKIDDPSSPV